MTSPLTDAHLRAMHGWPGTTIKLAFDGSVASAVLEDGRTYMVQSDSNCHIVAGAAPTATADDMPVAAWTPYLLTANGADQKLAAIKDTAAGNLFLTPLTGYRI